LEAGGRRQGAGGIYLIIFKKALNNKFLEHFMPISYPITILKVEAMGR